MRKIFRLIVIFAVIGAVIWGYSVFSDRTALRENLIRLHIVANSDKPEDQQLKLKVRDAVLEKVEAVMQQIPDMETAKKYLQENLGKLENISNEVLRAAGSTERATVTLTEEVFPTREYDTFTLPAGVYESLRITIGDGEGKNWWCVVFPRLCISATSADMEDMAVSAGFSNQLAGAISGEPTYRIRFFTLDCLGWLENLFYRG